MDLPDLRTTSVRALDRSDCEKVPLVNLPFRRWKTARGAIACINGLKHQGVNEL